MPVHLPNFDPSRGPFKAKKGFFRFNGIIYKRGDPFPAEGATMPSELKLKQLYETHFIRYADDDEPLVREPIPPSPDKRRRRANRAKGAAEQKAKPEGTRDERANRLMNRHNKAKLLELAKGLDLPEKPTNKVIAEAIVDAERDGDGAA